MYKRKDYDKLMFSGRKGTGAKWNRLTKPQLIELKKYFDINCKPNLKYREQIAIRLQLSKEKVKNWFSNKNASIKFKKAEEKKNIMQNINISIVNGDVVYINSHFLNIAPLISEPNSYSGQDIWSKLLPKIYPGCNDLYTLKRFDYKFESNSNND